MFLDEIRPTLRVFLFLGIHPCFTVCRSSFRVRRIQLSDGCFRNKEYNHPLEFAWSSRPRKRSEQTILFLACCFRTLCTFSAGSVFRWRLARREHQQPQTRRASRCNNADLDHRFQCLCLRILTDCSSQKHTRFIANRPTTPKLADIK